MRIISGTARGRKLSTFSGREIRPTPDRVREALFSILLSRLGSLEGKKILDLFAGTGALSLEALSRGARSALLIDGSTRAATLIRTNIAACGFGERASLRRGEVQREIPRLQGETFDLIFLDPPYGRGLVPETIAAIARLHLLAPGGLICAEAERHEPIPETIATLFLADQRHYGSTSIHVFTFLEEAESRPE